MKIESLVLSKENGVLCFEIEIRCTIPNLCLGLNTNHNAGQCSEGTPCE